MTLLLNLLTLERVFLIYGVNNNVVGVYYGARCMIVNARIEYIVGRIMFLILANAANISRLLCVLSSSMVPSLLKKIVILMYFLSTQRINVPRGVAAILRDEGLASNKYTSWWRNDAYNLLD